MSKKTVQRPQLDRIDAAPEEGLSQAQVEERVKKGYVNIATDPNEKSVGRIIAGNLLTFFNIVLFSIAAVYIILMIYLNAIGRSDIVNEYFGFSKFIFLIPAVMNVAMGSYQEISSLKVIKKLRIVTSAKSRVIRGGKAEDIEAEDIVLDDIVAVAAGHQATADLLVLSGEAEVDESMLTGEADFVKKRPGDQILSGSSIMVGSARCRAVKIGNDTYAAELTRKVKSSSGHKSELMGSITRIIKILTVGLCIAALVTTVTLAIKISAYGSDTAVWGGLSLSLSDPVTWSLIILTNGMFGIGMIPSGLVLTTSVAMMVSIAQLTKKKTLVQELYSLENLSRVDVICLDKTGTLTDGTMSVCEVKPFIGEDAVKRHLRVLMSASGDRNATSEAVYNYFGSEEGAEIKEAIPFSSAVKYSGIVYPDGKKLLMGAPEYLLPKGDVRLSYVEEKAGEGNRVIAVTLEGELIAFIAIEDHIRETAGDTLKFFRENGVTVKVISGDNPLTVSRIAQKCGIANAEKYISLAGVPLEDIPAIAEEYTVFARVSPEQKEALVSALQAKKHKVAMTGDGVNDILALRKADSSITFAKATEAAKSCSDVVLLDNDFSHLKEVVGEGRRVIGNTQKTAVLYLMKSLASFILAFGLIPFAKGQMWFSIENMYMLEAAVIGTGGFLMSLEPRRTPVKGSFMKNIVSQSLCAGGLAAIALLVPILLNAIPKAIGGVPFISDECVRPMMTVMLSVSGLVVMFSMCIPFNRYRGISLAAVTGVAGLLGFMFPTSYIGGQSMGADMFAFNSAAGQSFFDCRFMQEFFKPMNAPVVKSLTSDMNNYIVLRLFLYIAIPLFILLHFAVENWARKEFKDVKLNRSFRIGRRLLMVSGFVLILHALLSVIEILSLSGSLEGLTGGDLAVMIVIDLVMSAAYVAIGIIGYKTWKDPTKKMIKIAFIASAILSALAASPIAVYGSMLETNMVLLLIDATLTVAAVIVYLVGAWIIFSRIHLGLDRKRDS